VGECRSKEWRKPVFEGLFLVTLDFTIPASMDSIEQAPVSSGSAMGDIQSEIEARVSQMLRRGGLLNDETFTALALEIHEFQLAHNEPYRRYSLSRNPSVATHWREIPAVPQSAFKHAELRCFPREAAAREFRTSGTTGEGFGRHFLRSTSVYDDAIIAGWRWIGLPELPLLAFLPSPEEAPHSSLSHMAGVLGSIVPAQFCIRGSRMISASVDGLSEPVLLFGTALAFLELFDSGIRRRLPAGSVAVETGGYKGSKRTLAKAELYHRFETHLGIEPASIWNEYGMTELSSQCYARSIAGVHRAPPWMRVLVIDPSTGDEAAQGGMGSLRIFDLANVGSVMAIQTQDLAVREHNGFRLLGRDPSALPRGCSRAADEMFSR
jgi:hypothetical protein